MKIQPLLLSMLIYLGSAGITATQAVAETAAATDPAATEATAASGTWHTAVDNAVAAARDGDRYILVDLYAEWCGWCKVLEDEVFTSPEFRTFTQEMVLLRVDVDDGGEGSELQARFGANSLPTTLILDASLAKIGEVRGYAPTPKFITSVRSQLDEYDAMLDVYGKALRGGDVAILRRLGEDFHNRGDSRRAATLYEAALARIDRGGEAAAWLHYLIADARRLNGDLQQAESSFLRAHRLADHLGDERLAEQLAMLRYYLAHDNGDCPEAVTSLEKFLQQHPRSGFRSQAKYTLVALRRGEGMECI